MGAGVEAAVKAEGNLLFWEKTYILERWFPWIFHLAIIICFFSMFCTLSSLF